MPAILARMRRDDARINARTGHCPIPESPTNLPGVNAAEALLAARLKAGDDRALTEIFDSLASAVYRSAHGILGQASAAEDIVQEVFVELWRHPDRYDPAAATLRTFLVMQARSRALDALRSEIRRLARQERHHRLTPEQPTPSPCDLATDAEGANAVRAAVRLLPEVQRRVIELAYFHGLTCREIALVDGIPEGTAKSRLRLALGKLSTALDRRSLESS